MLMGVTNVARQGQAVHNSWACRPWEWRAQQRSPARTVHTTATVARPGPSPRKSDLEERNFSGLVCVKLPLLFCGLQSCDWQSLRYVLHMPLAIRPFPSETELRLRETVDRELRLLRELKLRRRVVRPMDAKAPPEKQKRSRVAG